MNTKLLASLFLIFLAFSATFVNSQDDLLVNEMDDTVERENMKGQNEEMEQKMRSISMSCVLLTKHKIYDSQKQLGEVLESFSKKQQEQNLLYRKIFAVHLATCYQSLTFETSQKFLEEIQKKDFQSNVYFYVFDGFQWEDYKDPSTNTELTQLEEGLFKFAEEFEEAMKQRQQQEQDQKDDETYRKRSPEDFEPRIAGFSFKNTHPIIKIGYLIGIFAVIGAIIYIGNKKLFSPHELIKDPKKKKKFDEKKK